MNPNLRRLSHAVGRRLPNELTWKLRFLNGHGRWPRLSPPRTQNEKILWQILYDRRPELVRCTDKLLAKQMVEDTCQLVRVPETFWVGTDFRELAQVDLPERWVLKPNNSCGSVFEGSGSLTLQQSEELGQLDFRGFVIGGELRAILITWRVTQYPYGECSFYDPDFNLLPVSRIERPVALSRPVTKIDGFREAVEEVAAVTGLESLRVDLFHWKDELWFGETTVYPVDGLVQYWPRSFDFELGAHWPDQSDLCETT